jgi:cell division protein FtsQ
MARKASFTIAEDELDGVAGESEARSRTYNESPLDARMLDLDDEAESPFLRGQKRVSVRRGPLPRKAASRLKVAFVLIALIACAGAIWFFAHQYATQSWRFRIDSSDNIAVSGARNVSRSQIMDVMAGDIDRNIFYVPLDVRKKQLEQIPWVQSASVARVLPNRLRIAITERTPVAFVQVNSRIELIDAQGVIMEQPAGPQPGYSFPVVIGMSDAEPLSTRAARMKIYVRLVKELDAGGAHYSRDLSDVDPTDPDDVKATVTDPQGAVLVHLGTSNFLERFELYVTHVQAWRAQFQNLQSVDLRYEHQVIVNPDASTAVGNGTVAAAGNGGSPAAGAKPEEAPKKTVAANKKKKQR